MTQNNNEEMNKDEMHVKEVNLEQENLEEDQPQIQYKTVIGITGITGSGTSTVSNMLKSLGGLYISADQLAHEIILKGGIAYNEVIQAFGKLILQKDGEINRKTLGTVVFKNQDRLKILEGIIHPGVKTHIHQMLTDKYIVRNYVENNFAIIDAPLLVESELNTLCSHVCLVTAPDATRVERIVARDGLAPHAIRERISTRKGDDFLKPHAQFIIENNADLASLESQVRHMATTLGLA